MFDTESDNSPDNWFWALAAFSLSDRMRLYMMYETVAYTASSAIRIATYTGTRGAKMPHVKMTEHITGRNGNMMVSIICW